AVVDDLRRRGRERAAGPRVRRDDMGRGGVGGIEAVDRVAVGRGEVELALFVFAEAGVFQRVAAAPQRARPATVLARDVDLAAAVVGEHVAPAQAVDAPAVARAA